MFKDRAYISGLFNVALPIIAQNIFSSVLNMLDVAMIGQLGDTSVAAVGLANQLFFLMLLMMFGINGGAGVFIAQLWGKGDVKSIHKVQGISLGLGLSAGILFTVLALAFPQFVLGIYTQDQAVIASGSDYLRIVGWSYLATALTLSFSSVLRSVRLVRIPMVISIAAISLKTFLNFGLILGNLGMPAMGVEGAATATLVTRSLEAVVLLLVVYLWRLPPAATLKEFLGGYQPAFMFPVLRTSFPVVINETLWSLGTTVYNIAYARIGTESIAAVNIAATIEGLAFVIFIGISEACGILIGNRIGAGEEEKAFLYARRTLSISMTGAILMGFMILFLSGFILQFYKISDAAHFNAQNVLRVMSFALWIKVTNLTLIVGILRAGGDTRFGMFLDAGSVWLVGVPLALLGAFVLHLPVHLVYLMVISEEFVKLLIAMWRFLSKRWVNNLSRSVT